MAIILMSVDPLTERIAGNLKKLYPSDRVSRFEKNTPLLSTEKDERTSPARLTLLGHSTPDKFADMSAATVASLLATELRNHSTVTDIDFISCMTGLTDADGHCFAQEVSNLLLAQGIKVSVNSFTDLVVKKSSPYLVSGVVQDDDTNEFKLLLFKSTGEHQEYLKIGRQLQICERILKLQKELAQIAGFPKTQQEKLFKNIVNQFLDELSEKDKSLTAQRNDASIADTLNHIGIRIASNDLKNAKTLSAYLEKQIPMLTKRINILDKKGRQLRKVAAAAQNPREYFDATQACKFLPNIAAAKKYLDERKAKDAWVVSFHAALLNAKDASPENRAAANRQVLKIANVQKSAPRQAALKHAAESHGVDVEGVNTVHDLLLRLAQYVPLQNAKQIEIQIQVQEDIAKVERQLAAEEAQKAVPVLKVKPPRSSSTDNIAAPKPALVKKDMPKRSQSANDVSKLQEVKKKGFFMRLLTSFLMLFQRAKAKSNPVAAAKVVNAAVAVIPAKIMSTTAQLLTLPKPSPVKNKKVKKKKITAAKVHSLVVKPAVSQAALFAPSMPKRPVVVVENTRRLVR